MAARFAGQRKACRALMAPARLTPAIVPLATHDSMETAKPKQSRMNGCHSSRVESRQTKLRMFQAVRVAMADETIGIGLCTGSAPQMTLGIRLVNPVW
jgi:hypothetical protein